MLTRDQFFSGPKPKTTVVAVPALGGSVGVKQLTVGEADRYSAALAAANDGNTRARLVVAVAVDEKGDPLFTDADVAALAALRFDILDPIVEAASSLNALSDQDRDALAKN